ncbi:hypothetical protein [Risungbinella massiliensis]|uniref:hypothetical protein n=1 Tax=Risungbinella massiliensis TaxID=1329796 RepID=UPI0011C83C7D|nr:hypothetical protein [Risungbinella massiliensis]
MSKLNIQSKLPQNLQNKIQLLVDMVLQLVVRVQVEAMARLGEFDAKLETKLNEFKFQYQIKRNKFQYMLQFKLNELKQKFQRQPKTQHEISYTTHYLTIQTGDQTPQMVTIKHIMIRHTEVR